MTLRDTGVGSVIWVIAIDHPHGPFLSLLLLWLHPIIVNGMLYMSSISFGDGLDFSRYLLFDPLLEDD